MIIKFAKKFDKSYHKLPIKIQDKFNEKLIIFEEDKLNILLNNHGLSWKIKWLNSIKETLKNSLLDIKKLKIYYENLSFWV